MKRQNLQIFKVFNRRHLRVATTIRVKGSRQLNAVMYACSAVQTASRRNFTVADKRQALNIGTEAGRVEGTFSHKSEDLVLELDPDESDLIAGASRYFIDSRDRRVRRLRAHVSPEVLEAARDVADASKPHR